ncbi:acetylxylan esterase [Paenibacillus sp. P96]|uniref:Acetylxylan esterase n=1 Tax=Paenibacillus zeirhizosphaerae TaxID=2987519 RepID=A0ABT9FUI9_9BACL|nr:alpha/beta fold hydrolase [Paenibacillus sp. P96]MDP4098371.1 acetylxylan esterase [Paenibacillus sp. P96]
MNAIEKRINDLTHYSPDLTAPADLNAFWERSLREANAESVFADKTPVPTPYPYMEVFHITYKGWDDTPLHAWYIRPAFANEKKLPCVVLFHSYAGGKGYPEQYASWLMLGFAVLAMDVRGQGGETGNGLDSGYGTVKGWVTQGILSKDTCYYKAITIDAIKAVNWVSEQPDVDSAKIAVCGASQGGGLALMVSALSRKPSVAVANIPNMCHMDFGILNSTSSLSEAAEFVHRFPEHLDKVLNTLSYFDMLNLGSRITIPVMVSVGLKDTVCMPETVFAAYNRMTTEKHIEVYPFTGHAVEAYQQRKTAEFIADYFKI